MRSIICPTENSLSPSGRGCSSLRADCCSQIHRRDRSPHEGGDRNTHLRGFLPAHNACIQRRSAPRVRLAHTNHRRCHAYDGRGRRPSKSSSRRARVGIAHNRGGSSLRGAAEFSRDGRKTPAAEPALPSATPAKAVFELKERIPIEKSLPNGTEPLKKVTMDKLPSPTG